MQSVSSKPVIIGRKLENDYVSSDEGSILEIGINVDNSIIARQITGLSLTYCSTLVVDLGFVIEAVEQEELPEHILGGVRLIRPDCLSAIQSLS